jgi:hypothetical protein
MLEITTMGRNATIMFDTNEYSKKIDLGTGYTQGNGPSPILFNFCQQILIFKIEFNPAIKEIEWPRFKMNIINAQANESQESRGGGPAPDPDLVPVQHPARAVQQQVHDRAPAAVGAVPQAHREAEGRRPPPQPPDPAPDPPPQPPDPAPDPPPQPPDPAPDQHLQLLGRAPDPQPHPLDLAPDTIQVPATKKGKVEGFADDTSVLGKAEERALNAIKQDLVIFARISGLKVNFEKCILIPIGFTGNVPEYFAESGFKVANSVRILGFEVYNDVQHMSKNFDTIIEKIISIQNFWNRFNLSLPGRMAVAKTLMLSQLGYMGCILDPDPAQLDTISNLIYSFVKGKLNVAFNRITLPVETGGLGMIEINDYLTALRCTWVKRASLNQNDLWSTCLDASGVTRPDVFMPKNLCPKMFPVISVFDTAIYKLASAILSVNNNVLKSRILDNPVFAKSLQYSMYDNFIFEAEPNRAALKDLTVEDILNGFVLKSKAEIEAQVNTNIQQNTYTILFRAVRGLCSSGLLQDAEALLPPTKVITVLIKPKKGSKVYRNYLTKLRIPKKPANTNSFKKFFALCETTLDQDKILSKFNSRWNVNGASNKLREFVFKFCNNLLGLNSRVNHFNRLINEDCTFCTVNKNFPAPRETFIHLFFNCPETSATLVAFVNKYLENLDLNTAEKRRLFWFFGTTDKKFKCIKKFLGVTTSVILFYVWDCKLRNCK